MEVGRTLVPLPDGRVLAVSAGGPRDVETALLFELGLPSGSEPFPPAVDWAERHGLRFLTFARPGYGGSTRHPGRTVSTTAAIVASVAEALGIHRLHAVGWSAGGPFILALGALRPDLVASVATMGGLAPIGFYDDWPRESAALEAAAERFVPDALQMADALERGEPPDWGPADVAAMRGPIGAFMAETVRDGLASGFWGVYDDVVAIDRLDWGFDPDAMRVPVAIWHGHEEQVVPVAHARWLVTHVQGARLHLVEGEGHVSLGARQLTRILDELVASATI